MEAALTRLLSREREQWQAAIAACPTGANDSATDCRALHRQPSAGETRRGTWCFDQRVDAREVSFDDVTLLPVEWSGVVAPESVDHNGHMNIERYFELHCRALARLFDRFGIDDAYRATHQQGLFTIEQHLRYLNEATEGERMSVYMRVLERSNKIVHNISYLTNDDRRVVANTVEWTAAHVDLRTRRAVPFLPAAAAAIDREVASTSQLRWQSTTCGSMGTRRSGAMPRANHRSTASADHVQPHKQ